MFEVSHHELKVGPINKSCIFFSGHISLYVFKSKIVRDLGLSRVGVFSGECDETRGAERS